MACREYEGELRKLAAGPDRIGAGGLALAREARVRAHLAGCAACREAREVETQLFAAVDVALREEVNAEAPASLAARIRIAAEAEQARPRVARWRWALVAGAVTAIVVAVMVTQRGAPPASLGRAEPTESARQTIPALPTSPAMAQQGSEPVVAASREPKQSRDKPPAPEPEVLVPAGEEEALARFAGGLRAGRGDAEALLEAMQKKPAERLEISPIVVANLEMKPLGEAKSER